MGLNEIIQPGMFSQPFMQNAIAASSIAAILAGLIGFFVVARGASFAAHALGQIGFAGAAGAVLVGLDPLWGLVVFALAGALGLGVLGVRERGRDALTALLLVTALGVGYLFIALNSVYSTSVFALLFGTIVGISRSQVWETGALAAGSLLALAALYRPLLLATVNDELAAARGVPIRWVSLLFLSVVGIAAAVTIPIAGTLLIFSLIVGPAAAAMYVTSRPRTTMLVSVGIALLATWSGLTAAYDTGQSVGFFISAAVGLSYALARLAGPRLVRRAASREVRQNLEEPAEDGLLERSESAG